ncbi:MAG: hypothetical protein GY720_08980 [bacterium]|nr:hypothetical protein [bacterium]
MEATGTDARRRPLIRAIRWVSSTRAVRFPLLVISGALLTLWIASYVDRNYIDLCERYSVFPSRCEPVSLRTAYSTGLGIAGLAMLTVGPIVNSIYHLLRYGQPWESTRVETAISNYPLLAGLIYLAGAGLLVLL